MNTADNIIHLTPSATEAELADARMLVGKLARLSQQYLPPLLQSLLDKADTTLFEMADKAENNSLQAHYFDTMRELRQVRAEIEQGFATALGQGFSRAMQRKPQSSGRLADLNLDADSMSLVDEAELEESLAIKVMVDKIGNMEHKLLEAVSQRMEHLLAPCTGKPVNNPLSPQAICDGFHESLKVLQADLAVRLVIYKLFDLNVVSNLGPFYEAVNTLLIQAGVLSQLPHAISKSASRSRPAPAQSEAAAVPAAQGTGIDPEENLLNLLQDLLRSPSSGGVVPIHPGATLADGRAIAAIGAGELVQTLTRLQQEFSSGEAIDSGRIKHLIADHLPGSPEGSIAGFQQRESIMIDVVAMLFSVILEDRDIPDVAKALIGRLQIPLVKVALLDDSFLGKKAHPARQLLNRLAQLCNGLDQYVDSDTPVLLEVRRIIESISADFDSDLQVFERELEALELFMALQGDEDERVSGVIHEAKTRHEQQERIRIQVDETIRIKLAMSVQEDELPEMIHGIINGPWRQTLLHTAHEHGIDSTAWQSRSDLIHKLIDSIRPRTDAVARSQLLKAIPAVIMGLRQGLNEAGFEQEAIACVLNIIEPLHMAILSPSMKSDAPAASEEQLRIDATINEMESDMENIELLLSQMSGSLLDEEELKSAIPDEFMEEIVLASEDVQQDSLVDDEYMETVRAIQIGQMIILYDKEDKPLRARLAWKSDYLGEYVFTNWRHKVVAERTLNGLAADLYRHKLVLLDDTPILERAMETVFSTLRIQRSSLQTETLVTLT